MTLSRVCASYCLLGVQQDMLYGLSFRIHLVLKAETAWTPTACTFLVESNLTMFFLVGDLSV